jgi:hypothetical protein
VSSQRVLRQALGDLHPGFDASDRGDTDDQGRAPVDVPVAALAPRADERGRDDGQQARRLGVDLRQAEDEGQGRHEEDPAADAEEAGENPCGDAETCGGDERPHQTRSLAPIAASSAANAK